MIVSLVLLTLGVDCDLAGVTQAKDLHHVLGARSVEVIARAASDGWRDDGELADLVAPAATFSLGAGDVGRPLAAGPEGAHEMARLLHADAFRFMGWNYMNMPADGCARSEIKVTFDDRETEVTATVTFVFENGQIISAAGWQGAYIAGELPLVSQQ